MFIIIEMMNIKQTVFYLMKTIHEEDYSTDYLSFDNASSLQSVEWRGLLRAAFISYLPLVFTDSYRNVWRPCFMLIISIACEMRLRFSHKESQPKRRS
jgi:hypothetical protein